MHQDRSSEYATSVLLVYPSILLGSTFLKARLVLAEKGVVALLVCAEKTLAPQPVARLFCVGARMSGFSSNQQELQTLPAHLSSVCKDWGCGRQLYPGELESKSGIRVLRTFKRLLYTATVAQELDIVCACVRRMIA